MAESKTRRLILVLGDQLDRNSPALRGADPEIDVVALAEVRAEVNRFPNHRNRVAVFLSAMRHFRRDVEAAGFEVEYQLLSDANGASTLPKFLERVVKSHQPEELVMCRPGRHDLVGQLRATAKECGVSMKILEDSAFLASDDLFADWADGRKSLVMEHFYRFMRRHHGYLVRDSKPEGGQWNFDKENRKSFGKKGPPPVPSPMSFPPDEITMGVLEDIREDSNLVGSPDSLDLPVTPKQAQKAVDDFVENRLPTFGTYQDAMWTDEAYLFHSRIATALNLKLLDPRYAIERAIEAYEAGASPLNSVEGFVRQVLGWREFVRGVYWREMPGYLDRNELGANRPLPKVYWSGETEMACMAEVIAQLLRSGYAHHIQRLMVTGLFALLYGANPRSVHDWYMAMFVDSVEWVTAPNTIGMSQHADGGIVGTKPYVATGNYIQRMSNYCSGCRFNPKKRTGKNACPFTTLYWDFLDRHRDFLSNNRRMGLQLRNLDRIDAGERKEIRRSAERVKKKFEHGDL